MLPLERWLDITLESQMRSKSLKLVSAIFYQIFIFHHMIALQKLWEMFISPKKLFLFSRYSNFCKFVFPYSFPLSHCFRGWFKKNLKVYDVVNGLNKNLVTHYVWYLEKEIRLDIETLPIDKVLNRTFLWKKSCRKCTPKASPRPLFNFAK